MRSDNKYANRKKLRLSNYDYSSPRTYEVTICTNQRQRILADVVEGVSVHTDLGAILTQCWHDLPNHYRGIKLDVFMIMPDHVHAIVHLEADEHDVQTPLSEIVRYFKTTTSKQINRIRDSKGLRVWQHSFFDRIVRDQEELAKHRNYILDNPRRWYEKYQGHLDHETVGK